jgi:hypothetical protein
MPIENVEGIDYHGGGTELTIESDLSSEPY